MKTLTDMQAVNIQAIEETQRGPLIFVQVLFPSVSTVAADDIKNALPANGRLDRRFRFDADSLRVSSKYQFGKYALMRPSLLVGLKELFKLKI